jgi:hypothetical protein
LKGILPKFLEKKREREAQAPKIRKKKKDDEEYKPSKEELEEIHEEEKLPQSQNKRSNNNNNNPRVTRTRGRGGEKNIQTQNEKDKAQKKKPLEKNVGKSSSSEKTEDKKSGFWNFMKILYEGFSKSFAYVDAIHNLPPTFTIGEVGGFNQIVADPENFGSADRKFEAAEKAEKNWHDFCEKYFEKK